MRTVQERNDQIAELKVELESQIEQKQALQDQIDQANREKYEFASERSGSPPGTKFLKENDLLLTSRYTCRHPGRTKHTTTKLRTTY